MEFALPIYGYGPDRTMNQENAENMAPERKNPSELPAGEIVKTLYANEPDQTIAAAARDEVVILTGESKAVELYGYIKIGQYKENRVYEHCEIWALLGETNFRHIKTEDGYLMLMPLCELPDKDKAARNRQSL